MAHEARETRRSLPFLTADEALRLELDAEPPVVMRGRTLDASELPREEDLELRLEVDLDWSRLGETTGSSGPFEVSTILRCHDTRWSSVRRLTSGVRTGDMPLPELSEVVTLERSHVSDTAELEVVVTPDGSESAAESDGNRILARSACTIRFRRSGFEFPTRWVSFRDRFRKNALWVVHIELDSWTLPVEDAVEVLLNRDAPDFYRILESGLREHLVPARLLRSQIAYDALGQIFSEYLLGQGIEEAVEPDGQRFCDVVARTLEQLFDQPPDRLRKLLEEDPAEFAHRLQHGMEMRNLVSLD